MQFWGWYERDVRVSAEVIHRLWVRRARCCERTHALLPGFVEVIGSAVETMCGGVGVRRVAEGLGLKHTTVRDWRRRFARRAALLAVGFCRYVVALGDVAPRLSGGADTVAVAAAKAAWAAARRRFGDGVGCVAAGERRGRRAPVVSQHGSALGGGLSLALDAHRRLPTVGDGRKERHPWTTTTATTGPSRWPCSGSA
jgi:hypothetical protein